MEVTVRLFAMLRERAGDSTVTLDLADGARVSDALAALNGLTEGLPLVMAVKIPANNIYYWGVIGLLFFQCGDYFIC